MKAFSHVLSTVATLVCVSPLNPAAWVAAQGNSSTAPIQCPSRTADAPAVTPDSVGYLLLAEPLGRLQELCRAARDTTVRLRSDEGTPYPGLVFHFDSLTVIGLQYKGLVLDLARAADGWIVAGTRATIEGKLPLSASWASLRATFGSVQANVRGVLAVRFCSFPNAIITLNVDPNTVVTRGGQVELSTIPADATIHHVFIMARSLASHLRGC